MSWIIATGKHSVRLFGNGLRFFAGEGAKKTVIATPTAILGSTALAPVAAAAVTVATVALAAGSIFSLLKSLLDPVGD